MTLAPGTRLGPHEIIAAIGAGGMGEVYRARDTRLGREVAIKVLPAHLSAHPEIRARFEREAHAVSALNHPNICVLHDVGHQDGIDYLVLELVEGETLAQRLAKGPLPADLLLKTAIEIADALERAHRSNIVHRDLKPGNVMLTRSGAKLMDFGLARATGIGPASGDLTSSPTVSRPLTAEGTLVGTFHYMAPEQLEGKEADARSDLWGYGATLYEMATGRKAFDGRSQASLIAAILEREPTPIGEIAPLSPPGLDRLVRACLAKDPEQRLQTAHDAKLQLQWIAEGGSQAGVPAPVAARRRGREALAWTLAAAAFVAAAGLGVVQLGRKPEPKQVVRFHAEVPPRVTNTSWPRVSPDGRWLAFLADDSTGTRRIWLRPIDAFGAYPLPGADAPGRPFWSPDGKSLAYFSENKLRRISVGGGPAVTVGAALGSDGSWGKDYILFDGNNTDSLRMIPVAGGDARPASRIDRASGEFGNAWPYFLPDGEHFLYVGLVTGGRPGMIRLGSIGSLAAKSLGTTDGRVEYAPPGYLVFTREGTLMAQPFDLGRLAVRGDAVPIGERVTIGLTNGEFSVSPRGVLAYRTSESQKSRLVWVDRTGKVLDESCPPGIYTDFSLSPDQRQVAVAVWEENGTRGDVWIRDFARGVLTRLTFCAATVVWPVWSPDGGKIAYAHNGSGEFRTYIQSLAGQGQIDSLPHQRADNEGPADWSRDGRYLLEDRSSAFTTWDVVVRSLDGDRAVKPLVATKFVERQSRFSPDGQWVAYSSDESGRREVYLQAFPGPGRKLQVSTVGGSMPNWRADGRELYFRGPEQTLMAVPIQLGPSPEIGTPVKLFRMPIFDVGFTQSRYAASKDGSRFLVVSPMTVVRDEGFSVVTNFTADIRR
jgi:eukaryotic-like serine/threonine-protein kinase